MLSKHESYILYNRYRKSSGERDSQHRKTPDAKGNGTGSSVPIPPTIPPHLRHGMPSTSIAAGLAAAAAGMAAAAGSGAGGHLGGLPGLGVGLPPSGVPNSLAQSYQNSINNMAKAQEEHHRREQRERNRGSNENSHNALNLSHANDMDGRMHSSSMKNSSGLSSRHHGDRGSHYGSDRGGSDDGMPMVSNNFSRKISN